MDVNGVQANELAGLTVAESLAGLGIIDVVISPGSRSTPLTCAFARDTRFRCKVVLDERSAGFFALGKSKASGIPTVLLCTSGTAVANYLPAIVEARYSHTPLLVLTADRPLSEQHCHAGQTILQSGIFTSFVSHEQQLEVPRANLAYLRYLRETIREAAWMCKSPQSGVVHLNFPFEGQLTPGLSEESYYQLKKELSASLFTSPIHQPEKAFSTGQVSVASFLKTGLRCGWILGPSYQAANEPALKALLNQLERLKVPVLVDVLNPARAMADQQQGLITLYEWMVNPRLGFQEELKLDVVFQVGNLPTSKSLRDAISRWDCHRIKVEAEPDSDNRDPTHSRTIGTIALSEAIRQLEEFGSDPHEEQVACFERWAKTQSEVSGTFERVLQSNEWVEPVICKNLPKILSNTCDLFISNSMIVRDMENFFSGSSSVRRVFSNRGANGIDGILSTALGAADNCVPLICILGDLAFLHDSGALKLKRTLECGVRVLLVVLDNQGGGIFEHLPIASVESTFEDYFATPQSVDIPELCKAYDVKTQQIDNLGAFSAAVGAFLNEKPDAHDATGEITCLNLTLDRKQSYQFRRSALSQLLEKQKTKS